MSHSNGAGPALHVDDVQSWPDTRSLLAGFSLGHPSPGAGEDVLSIPVQGWALGREQPVRELTVNDGQGQLVTLPVAIPRPDIAADRPDLPWAERSGFGGRLGAVHLPREFSLELSVVMDDGTRTYVGRIGGRRRRLPVIESARFQPVTITTLGRSGSTWLTWVLGMHPELISYRSFGFEPKVTAYFTEVARALTQPASYMQALRGEVDDNGWWRGDRPAFGLPWYRSDDLTDLWLGTDYVHDVLEFCVSRMDAFYTRLAAAEGKPQATRFVEKIKTTYFAQRMLNELYPAAREVFLVRDLRDVACSMFAFGRKRGLDWYWTSDAQSDEQIIRGPLREEVDELVNCWMQRAENAYLLRYEDLIQTPGKTLAELFAFIGVDDSAAAIADVLARASVLDPAIGARHSTTDSPHDSIGRWATELTPALRGACEESLGEALAAFGYA